MTRKFRARPDTVRTELPSARRSFACPFHTQRRTGNTLRIARAALVIARVRPRRSVLGGRSNEPGLSSRGAQRRGDPSGVSAGLPGPPSRARNDKPVVFVSRSTATKQSTELDRHALVPRARDDNQKGERCGLAAIRALPRFSRNATKESLHQPSSPNALTPSTNRRRIPSRDGPALSSRRSAPDGS